MTTVINATRAPADDGLLCLHGQGVAQGYAIGTAVVLGATSLEVAHYLVAPADVAGECQRLNAALAAAQDELTQLIATLPEDAPLEMAALLNVHRLLLADPLLTDQAQALINERHYNAEWALAAQGQLLGEQFAAMEAEYLRERGADVRQVVERVLAELSGSHTAMQLPDTPKRASRHSPVAGDDEALIVVAHDISPADMIRLRGGRFAAFCTDLGGATSHTAIIARSMDVPAVVGMANVRALVRDGDLLVVDGEAGVVVVNPTPAILAEYRARRQSHRDARAALSTLRDKPAITLDGARITLNANIELPDEAVLAREVGADGIGLFRSEFLFMGRGSGSASLPSEDEQYQAYAAVVQTMNGRPVTIRTLDLGADKTLDDEATVATNPALGQRAIRYCLARPELFATQLRAILRAAAHGPVKILLPMVAHRHEVQAARAALAAARDALAARGVAHAVEVPLGIMVEVPAAAIAIDHFAPELDFLSIGTNDLIQYTLAIDRTDHDVAALYDPQHPAVLRLIANTIAAGQRAGIPVAVCGEMAGDTAMTPLLLGLHLREFSMHPQQLLAVKGAVRAVRSEACTVAL